VYGRGVKAAAGVCGFFFYNKPGSKRTGHLRREGGGRRKSLRDCSFYYRLVWGRSLGIQLTQSVKEVRRKDVRGLGCGEFVTVVFPAGPKTKGGATQRNGGPCVRGGHDPRLGVKVGGRSSPNIIQAHRLWALFYLKPNFVVLGVGAPWGPVRRRGVNG